MWFQQDHDRNCQTILSFGSFGKGLGGQRTTGGKGCEGQALLRNLEKLEEATAKTMLIVVYFARLLQKLNKQVK
jgi:hypothetical protein